MGQLVLKSKAGITKLQNEEIRVGHYNMLLNQVCIYLVLRKMRIKISRMTLGKGVENVQS